MKFDWNQFRSHVKDTGLTPTEIKNLYQDYKDDLISLSDIPSVNRNRKIVPVRRRYSPRRYNYTSRSSHLENTLQNDDDQNIKNLANQPTEIVSKFAIDLNYKDIINLCQSNKELNEKLCKNKYFWFQKYKKQQLGNKTFKQYYQVVSSWNEHFVYVLDEMINFINLNFKIQKAAYHFMLTGLEFMFKHYAFEVKGDALRNYLSKFKTEEEIEYFFSQDNPALPIKFDYILNVLLVRKVLHETMMEFNPVTKKMYKYLNNNCGNAPGELIINKENLPVYAIFGLSQIKYPNKKNTRIGLTDIPYFKYDLIYNLGEKGEIGYYNPVEVKYA